MTAQLGAEQTETSLVLVSSAVGHGKEEKYDGTKR